MQQLGYYNAHNAAMTVVVPYTGEILAMVGSADFNNAAIEGQVNITTSPQQPGSAIKPIVYAAAFEQGWNPGTVVLDAPFRWPTPGAIDPATGEPSPYYEPQKLPADLQRRGDGAHGLANSLNIPAVKAAQFAGGAESGRSTWPAASASSTNCRSRRQTTGSRSRSARATSGRSN